MAETTTPPQEMIDEAKSRLDKVIPVAQEVLKIIGAHTELISDQSKGEREQEYRDIVKEVMTVFVERDINFTDRKFIFQVVLTAYDSVANQVTLAVEKLNEMANLKLFGKDILDIKMSDFERIING